MSESLFYEVYDELFASKAYSKEVGCVLELAGDALGRSAHRVLEIGCGTGNHTLALANSGAEIVAIDIDPLMVSRARKKLAVAGKKNADVRLVPVSKLEISGFDLACALFNVITYLGSREELDDFFKSVSARLAPDGVFFFDCWNGLAALKDPPRGKQFHCERPDRRIECELTSETDFTARKTRLSYRITILDPAGVELASGEHAFFQTLWTPAEITESLDSAGLMPFQCCPTFRPGIAATDADWKIMFLCKLR